MAKLLLLGASNTQLNAIVRAKAKGHTVIVTDYLAEAPGKRYADEAEMVSTFDAEGCLAVAQKYEVDGIFTVGTDQPVLTCAYVAQRLGLPSFLNMDTALAVTNKRVMKNEFIKNGIPTPQYRLLQSDFTLADIRGMRFPMVIKPLDSQGQRGVYKVTSVEEIHHLFSSVLQYSRESQILAEEYYESDEITLSGWVEQDEIHILSITDRRTFESAPHIGICFAHDFPSKYLHSHFMEIQGITKRIVKHFGIHNGPIYFQMLIGAEGVKVNEVACRIGGAYEDELIPLLTGFDILNDVIDHASGQEKREVSNVDILANNKWASVELLFIRPGIIGSMPTLDKCKKDLTGLVAGRFNVQSGMQLGEIENATQRMGYLIFEGATREELRQNITQAYQKLKILDQEGHNMLIDFRTGRST